MTLINLLALAGRRMLLPLLVIITAISLSAPWSALTGGLITLTLLATGLAVAHGPDYHHWSVGLDQGVGCLATTETPVEHPSAMEQRLHRLLG